MEQEVKDQGLHPLFAGIMAGFFIVPETGEDDGVRTV